MQPTCRYSVPTALVLNLIVGTAVAIAADRPDAKTAAKLAKTGNSGAGSSEIVQAGFVGDLQDTIVDDYETTLPRVQERQMQRQLRQQELQRQRHQHQRRYGYLRRQHDYALWWFCYTKGNGPAVWDRPQPEIMAHRYYVQKPDRYPVERPD